MDLSRTPLASLRVRAAWCVLVLSAPTALAACPGHIDDTTPYVAALEANGTGGASAGGAPSTGVGGAAGTGAQAGSGAGGGQAGCGDVPKSVLLPTCGPQGCHGGKKPASMLDLASPDVASRVVGVPGFACKTVLADPQDAKNSLLYTKIATAVPTCGGRMPLGIDPLDDATIACVADWIASLAPDGGAPTDAGSDAP